MARGRMISQTIDYDPEFNALSLEAQLLYLRAVAFLDRDGLIIGNPFGLLAKIAPLMESLISQMPAIISEWIEQGLVIRYTVKIGPVLFFKGFAKNQSGMHYEREGESRFDPPPGWIRGPKGLVLNECGVSPELVRSESGVSPEEIPSEVEVEVEVKETPRARSRSVDVHPNTQPILRAYVEALGYEPGNYGPEAKAAKHLAKQGYEPVDVTAAYALLKQQAFWQTKHLSLQTLVKEIPALKQALLNGVPLARAPTNGNVTQRSINNGVNAVQDYINAKGLFR